MFNASVLHIMSGFVEFKKQTSGRNPPECPEFIRYGLFHNGFLDCIVDTDYINAVVQRNGYF